MLKRMIVLAAVSVLSAVILAACASAAQPTSAPAPVVPQATQAAPVQNPPAQEPAVPETGGQAAAPICQTSGTSCAALDVADVPASDGYCVKKIRYHNIFVPPGTTFEEIDSTGDFKCFDQNQVVDGKAVIACTGEQLISYQLKLTNPSCGGSSLVTGTGQCQEGYGFDQTNQCCAPMGSGGGGSTTITVNIGACALPQSTSP